MALRVRLATGVVISPRLWVLVAVPGLWVAGGARAEPQPAPVAAAPPAGRIIELADVVPAVPVAGPASATETVTLPDKNGEPLNVRMKKGGLTGWIERNRPYRKRRTGDLPATLVASPDGADGADGAGPGAPAKNAGLLAAVEALRADTPKPSPGTPAPALAAFGPLELELLGLTAAVAITGPADVIASAAAPTAAVPQTVLDDLARRLGPVTQKLHGELTLRDDHVALLFLLPAAAQSGKSPAEVALLTEIAAAARPVAGTSVEIRVSGGGAGKSGADARRAAEKRLGALTGLLRAHGFDDEHARGLVVPMAQGVGQGGQGGDSLIVIRVLPPKSAAGAAK